MRRALVLISAVVLVSTGTWFAACKSDDSAAVPGGPQSNDSGSGSDSTAPASDANGGAADSATSPDASTTPIDSGTPTDSAAADASDAAVPNPCAADAGTVHPAKFDFAATASTLNGGKGQLLTVNVCDSVVWTNDDNGTDHGVQNVGGTFAFNTGTVTGTKAGVALPAVQFSVAGTFNYDCIVHGNMMIGQITVH